MPVWLTDDKRPSTANAEVEGGLSIFGDPPLRYARSKLSLLMSHSGLSKAAFHSLAPHRPTGCGSPECPSRLLAYQSPNFQTVCHGPAAPDHRVQTSCSFRDFFSFSAQSRLRMRLMFGLHHVSPMNKSSPMRNAQLPQYVRADAKHQFQNQQYSVFVDPTKKETFGISKSPSTLCRY